MDDPLIHHIVDGEFEILERLGAGGMGTVYLAMQRSVEREVVLKFLNAGRANVTAVERFRREAKLVCRLNHPNIVNVFTFGEDPEVGHYIAMEQVRGHELSELLHRPLALDATLDLAAQLASGLVEAHAADLIHRDLKPENLMVQTQADGRSLLKILDFGIAKAIDATAQLNITGDNALIGTPHYIAPEIITGQHPASSACDIYAAGLILYELLTGQHPIHADTIVDILDQQVTATFPPVSKHIPSLPPALDALVADCLHKHPDERPDATTLLRRIETIQRRSRPANVTGELPANLRPHFIDTGDGPAASLTLDPATLAREATEEAAFDATLDPTDASRSDILAAAQLAANESEDPSPASPLSTEAAFDATLDPTDVSLSETLAAAHPEDEQRDAASPLGPAPSSTPEAFGATLDVSLSDIPAAAPESPETERRPSSGAHAEPVATTASASAPGPSDRNRGLKIAAGALALLAIAIFAAIALLAGGDEEATESDGSTRAEAPDDGAETTTRDTPSSTPEPPRPEVTPPPPPERRGVSATPPTPPARDDSSTNPRLPEQPQAISAIGVMVEPEMINPERVGPTRSAFLERWIRYPERTWDALRAYSVAFTDPVSRTFLRLTLNSPPGSIESFHGSDLTRVYRDLPSYPEDTFIPAQDLLDDLLTIAERGWPDDAFINLFAPMVQPDGTVYSEGRQMTVQLMLPEPLLHKGRKYCAVNLIHNVSRVVLNINSAAECDDPTFPGPRCTFDELLTRVELKGPAEDITLKNNKHWGVSWDVTGFDEIPDDCP